MTGTANAEGICGTAAAIEYLAGLSGESEGGLRHRLTVGYQRIREHEDRLTVRLLDGLESIDPITVWGVTNRARLEERVATISITHAERRSPELAALLGERGMFVWAGHFYATRVTADLGLDPDGMVRIGLLHYNTADEVDRLLGALAAI
jgi:selenocysteine lyase/cysteine desulfurase